MKFSGWIKTFAVNLLVLTILLIGAELAFRGAYTVRTCINGSCNFYWLTHLYSKKAFTADYIGLSQFDETLGYVLKPDFSGPVTEGGWQGAYVSVNTQGFRNNSRELSYNENAVLAVGDSFTFGDKVSDGETWPSCLQDKLGVRVDNGGVFGYGAAQALRRAQLALEQRSYDTVILSVLTGRDIERDRLSYRSGFAKPYLANSEDGGLVWIAPGDRYVQGTKYNPLQSPWWEVALFRVSALYGYFAARLDFLSIPYENDRLTVTGENAAAPEDIAAFILEEFEKLAAPRKVLLLQYGRGAVHDPGPHNADIFEERALLKKRARMHRDIMLVDSYDALKPYDAGKVWAGHHTAFGNGIVCETLYKAMTHSAE